MAGKSSKGTSYVPSKLPRRRRRRERRVELNGRMGSGLGLAVELKTLLVERPTVSCPPSKFYAPCPLDRFTAMFDWDLYIESTHGKSRRIWRRRSSIPRAPSCRWTGSRARLRKQWSLTRHAICFGHPPNHPAPFYLPQCFAKQFLHERPLRGANEGNAATPRRGPRQHEDDVLMVDQGSSAT